ncbi:hypothetical protein GRI89_03525 [Altererythrobacter salegens]|uniref:Glycosyltransferase RgtA/B/C/D-like domain-containing protein n=1 Tax=Croceibacterium salegens TaxID=1737568 RepID=A0A6I4SRL1_9SPHN|nr:glycosyltransferase family 39 protein [Croceibacterium salegens]MXO58611.1 hypothetical protein [Croceibacterium salegens]
MTGRIAALWPFALIALVAFASRMVWFGDPVADTDEQLYSLIGAHILQGQLPFVDLWDRKPFGLFALFALAHAIGGPGPAAYQVLAAAFVALGGWLVYALARPLSNKVTATGAGLLYPLLVYAYAAFSAQSEVFFIPQMLGMLVLLRDRPGDTRHAALAMLLGGLALQVKYTVAPQCLFLGCVALWPHRRDALPRLLARAAGYALLGLLPTLAVAALYAALGHFDEFFYANFVSIFERLPLDTGRFDPRFLRACAPLALLAAGGVYAAWRLNPPARHDHYKLIAGWSMSVLVGIFMTSSVYIHYFAAFAPAAILLALPLLDVRSRARWIPLALVLAAGTALLNIPLHSRDTREEREGVEQLAAMVAPHVGRSRDCLLMFDGPTALYRMTGSCLPGRFVYPDHLNNALEEPALGTSQASEVARILAARPGAIVTADSSVTAQSKASTALVEQAIAQDYHPLGSVTFRHRTFRAWGRND